MTSTPRVSIGLPVYNGDKYLAESLDSLLGQSYGDFELIISDNASTDSTAEICLRYEQQDPRIRYFRQPRNIGSALNHNFVAEQARGELFKWAASDDLYGRDLLNRCVAALDEHPQVVLAHCWSAVIDSSGAVRKLIGYRVKSSAPEAPERFRSMLFDGWNDDSGGVIRTKVLLSTPLCGSYHYADRSLITEIGLHGPFYQVPDRLYFRRDHPGSAYRACPTMRSRCANLDPRRASWLRHPAARLYAEYLWSYVAGIRRAPLSPADRKACYRYLAWWTASHFVPRAGRAFLEPSAEPEVALAAAPNAAGISVAAVVAGRHPLPASMPADPPRVTAAQKVVTNESAS
jgi:glycosyltransferase involved in cell wall biosynthesis